jgi:hypothetical protein
MKQQKKLLKDAIREGRRQNKAARRARHEHARADNRCRPSTGELGRGTRMNGRASHRSAQQNA